MESTASQMKIKKIAAGLGIIQGIAWAIMSLICIVLYLKGDVREDPISYMDNVRTYIYNIFMSSSTKAFPNQTLDGGIYHLFMWIYFFEDLVWIAASIALLRKNDRKTLQGWSFITLFMCTWDFVFFVILGSDYNKCLDYTRSLGLNLSPTLLVEGICANGILPVFVVAAKGFTLWIFNIVLGVAVFQMSKQLDKDTPVGGQKRFPFF